MTTLITELNAVEMPFIQYAQKAGWIYVSPSQALKLRYNQSNRLFYQTLKNSLIKFNSQFINESNVDTFIQKIDNNISDNIEGNKKVLNYLRGQGLFFDTKKKRNRNVTLIDFTHPENNIFHVTNQWSYSNDRKTNRPDMMFLINGIPLAIVEAKKPGISDAMDKATLQLRRLTQETPELMTHPQVFNITNTLKYFYGTTWNYSRKNIFNWKNENHNQRSKNISLEKAVLTFFDKKHFLKLIQNWILFYYKENELQKTILKQHQTRAIEKTLKRCSEPSKNRALIWHTQGSGKTFTMLTTARLILEAQPQATVMIVVDRNELEGQLFYWVSQLTKELETSGILFAGAHSKKELKKLLQQNFKGLIVSMLHKFKDIPADMSTKKDFYIFIDEAHRSIEGELGNYLTGALPNATLIGFTGTPIDKTDKGKGTFKVFGQDDKQGYLDKYSIAESIEDGTTLKLNYSLAPNQLMASGELLEKEFFKIAETEGISDIETLNKVLTKSVKLKTFLKSHNRIQKITLFVAEHFKNNVQPMGYKAFLVAVDREACALYKKALDKYLAPDVSQVVYTKGESDISIVKKYYIDKSQEKDIRKNFIKARENPQILIVTDKLLTGFDAPILYCMYLDKPMRDHVLLQAIARVNRPYEDKHGKPKPCGLVVDFVGMFKSMKKALSFDSDEVSAVIEDIAGLFQNFKSIIENDMKDYLHITLKSNDKLLEKIVYKTMIDIDRRKKFINTFKKLESLYEILSPDKKLRPYLKDYKNLVVVYKSVIQAYQDKKDNISDVCTKTKKLIQEHTKIKSFPGIVKTYSIDASILKKLKLHQDDGLESKQIITLVRSIEEEAQKNSKQELYLISISERAKQIMKDFTEKQKTAKETKAELDKLLKEILTIREKYQDSTLSSQEVFISYLLEKKGVVNFKELASQINDSFNKFKDFNQNEDEKRHLKTDMYQTLINNISEEKLQSTIEDILTLIEKIKK